MLNNDRKIGFFKDTVHSAQYGLGSIQMPVTVKRLSGLIAVLVALEAA